MIWLLVLSAMAAGAANPFQSGANAELNKQLTQPFWSTIVVYVTGICVLFAILLCLRPSFPFDKVSSVPWWAWMGGLISVVPTIIGLTIAHRISKKERPPQGVTGAANCLAKPSVLLTFCRIVFAAVSDPSRKVLSAIAKVSVSMVRCRVHS